MINVHLYFIKKRVSAKVGLSSSQQSRAKHDHIRLSVFVQVRFRVCSLGSAG